MAGTDKRKTQAASETAPAVILVNPQLGQNIGTAARAMLNCGLTDLRLVAPRDGWPNDHAVAAASGADRVLDGATLFGDTARAIAGLQMVYATTARDRYMVKPVLTAREAAREMREKIAEGVRVGVLFGPERAGMENDDLALADALITIPLNPGFSSLNLAQSVLLVGYEWFQGADSTPGREDRYGWSPPADKELLLNFFRMLEHELDECGFLRNVEKRPSMVRNIRNMFQRAGLSEQELRTLHGMVACLTDWRAGTDELGEPVRRRRKRKSQG
ncbi:MAG: RNA methyltransferase [Alphaproteobacteria bacterium]|nr:RNA methyltransferase [Alphaproteobacteria bacterium]